MSAEEGEDICPVCREKISNPTTLNCCQHKYDLHCLQRWLTLSNKCPLCVKAIDQFTDNIGLVDHADSYLHRSLGQLKNVLDRSQEDSSEFDPLIESDKDFSEVVDSSDGADSSSEGYLSASSSFELSDDDSSGPPRRRGRKKQALQKRDRSPKRKQPIRTKRKNVKSH